MCTFIKEIMCTFIKEIMCTFNQLFVVLTKYEYI